MKHPIRGDTELHRKTYEVVCNKVRKFYGVPDAELFFQARRAAIRNQCETDEFGWKGYESLKEWHEAVVLKARMSPNAEVTGTAAALSPQGPRGPQGYASAGDDKGD